MAIVRAELSSSASDTVSAAIGSSSSVVTSRSSASFPSQTASTSHPLTSTILSSASPSTSKASTSITPSSAISISSASDKASSTIVASSVSPSSTVSRMPLAAVTSKAPPADAAEESHAVSAPVSITAVPLTTKSSLPTASPSARGSAIQAPVSDAALGSQAASTSSQPAPSTPASTPSSGASQTSVPPTLSSEPAPASPAATSKSLTPSSEAPRSSTPVSTPAAPQSSAAPQTNQNPTTSDNPTTSSVTVLAQHGRPSSAIAATTSQQKEVDPSAATSAAAPNRTTGTPETSASISLTSAEISTGSAAEVPPLTLSSKPPVSAPSKAVAGHSSVDASITAVRISGLASGTSTGGAAPTYATTGLVPTSSSTASSASALNDSKSFFDKPATVGGVFAAVAFALLLLGAAVFFCCRSRSRRNARRARRGVSWPVPVAGHDGSEDPFLDAPRVAPLPEMSQFGRFGDQHVFDGRPPLVPPPTAMRRTSASAGRVRPRSYQAVQSDEEGPFADWAATSAYRPSTQGAPVGFAMTKDPSLRAPSDITPDSPVVAASADSHALLRPRPVSTAESEPSIYPPSLHDVEDADSLYAREHKSSGPNPFDDAAAPPTPPPMRSRSALGAPATLVPPPIPPRHRSRVAVADMGLITPPVSSSGHSPPESPVLGKFEMGYPAVADVLANRMPTPEDMKERRLTPPRRTLLNVRPKTSPRV